jgi:hypothetical protein
VPFHPFIQFVPFVPSTRNCTGVSHIEKGDKREILSQYENDMVQGFVLCCAICAICAICTLPKPGKSGVGGGGASPNYEFSQKTLFMLSDIYLCLQRSYTIAFIGDLLYLLYAINDLKFIYN